MDNIMHRPSQSLEMQTTDKTQEKLLSILCELQRLEKEMEVLLLREKTLVQANGTWMFGLLAAQNLVTKACQKERMLPDEGMEISQECSDVQMREAVLHKVTSASAINAIPIQLTPEE